MFVFSHIAMEDYVQIQHSTPTPKNDVDDDGVVDDDAGDGDDGDGE